MANGLNLPLLGLAQGLLSAGAPSTQPVGFGGALSQGIGGLLAGQQAQQQIQDSQLRQQALRNQIEAQQQAQQAASQFGQGLMSAQEQGVPLTEAIQQNVGGLLSTPGTLQQGISLLGTGQVKQPSLVQEAIASGLKPGTPEFAEFIQKVRLKPETQINLEQGAQNVFAQEAAKKQASRFTKILEEGDAAQGTIDIANNLERLLPRIGTGTFTPATAKLSKFGKALGFDASKLGFPDADSADEFIALQNRLALKIRQEMPGQLSDRDIKFLKESVSSLGKTPEANARLIQAMRAVAQRAQLKASMAEAWVAKRKDLTGFTTMWNKFKQQNSAFGLK